MSIKPETAAIIAAGVARQIVSQDITVTAIPTYIGIWPTGTTAQAKARLYIVRPVADDVHFAIDAVPATAGINSARLFGDTEYVFPIHPKVDTLGFIAATGDSANIKVHLRGILV